MKKFLKYDSGVDLEGIERGKEDEEEHEEEEEKFEEENVLIEKG